MALDPSISLAYRPPQVNVDVPNPIQQFGQVLSLRNMMQQGQLGQLGLQSKMLELDQLRRQMQEQQDYADAMKAYAQRAGGASPIQIPPVQTGPVVPPVTAPPETTSYTPVAPYTPAAGASPASLSALMTPQTQAPAAAPIAQAPAMGKLALSRMGGMNAAQFIARFPLTGMSRIKEAFALDQAEAEAGIKQHDLYFKKADAMGRYAQAVKDSKDPAAQFQTSLMEAAGNGDLDPEIARQMIADGYEKHKNDINAFIVTANNGKDYSEIQKNKLAAGLDDRKQFQQDMGAVNNQADYTKVLAIHPNMAAVFGDTFSPQVKEAAVNLTTPTGERFQQSREKLAQDAQFLSDRGQIPGFIAQQPAEVQPYLQKLYDGGLPLDQFKQYAGLAATKAKPGETIPLPASVQQQHVETAAAQGLAAAQAGITAKDLNNEQLADAIIKNPKLWPTVLPAKQDELQPLLARRGFTQFTTKPSDTELKTLYDNQRNLDAVKTMRDDFASGKYDWITGKILGHAKDIPWIGDSGTVLEGKLDELRSTLGDLVKGGTLRSSDIPVYEKMFPKTTDTTDVIKGKLNNLYDRLKSDTSSYRSILQSSGRALPDSSVQTPAPGDQAPAGSTPGLEVSQPGAEPKMVWIGQDGKKYYKAPPVQQITVTDPRGVVHTFKTTKQAEDFKNAAGIQ